MYFSFFISSSDFHSQFKMTDADNQSWIKYLKLIGILDYSVNLDLE